MSRYTASVRWTRGGAKFTDSRYSRRHAWRFDGGAEVAGSSSPHSVPLPYSDAAAVDPEEAFVAAISSCHMLVFLFAASKAGFTATHYRDEAVGVLTKNERGVPWVSKVTLSPVIAWAERVPDDAELAKLHHAAHDGCFIANSVTTEIVVA